jgi:hypothetical protein
MSDDWIKIHSEIDKAFESGSIQNATEEQLQRWLQNLSTGNVPNESIRHRETIRGITINHIQMARTIQQLETTIRRLNTSNDKTQRLIIRLTWVAVIVGVFQAIAAAISLFR